MYDLVIIDVGMPKSSGYEACEQIKSLFTDSIMLSHQRAEYENTDFNYIPMNKRIPVLVALTSQINKKVIREVKDAGFEKLF